MSPETEQGEMQSYEANDGLLRAVLKTNAALSLAAGVVLVLAGGSLAAWITPHGEGAFGLSTAWLLRLVGIDVLAFAALCWWAALRRPLSLPLARTVIALEGLWVAGSAVLLTAAGDGLTTAGYWTVAVAALLALDFALLQGFALWQLYQGAAKVTLARDGAELHIAAETVVDAPSTVVWRVMADQEGYAEVADTIAAVEVLRGRGLGMVRRCSDAAGRSWTERCTLWEEGQAFAFVVDTAASDYPYPLRHLAGRWSMIPEEEVVVLRMDFVARPRPGLLNAVKLRLLVAVLLPVCDRLLARWSARMQEETRADWAQPSLRKSA